MCFLHRAEVFAHCGYAKQDEMILQVDFKNVFGSNLRDQMLKEVKAPCPILLPHAVACYKDRNYLFREGTSRPHPEACNKEMSAAPHTCPCASSPGSGNRQRGLGDSGSAGGK